jgi:thiol-disulfide isomerase/thioredoxin
MNTSLICKRTDRFKWVRRTLFLALLALLSESSAFAFTTGDTFPDLSEFEMEGSIPSIKGKVVLIDFFASWCAPCKASFPVMQELQKKFADQGFVIIGVNVDTKKTDMDRFLKKNPVDFATVRDAQTKLVSTMKITAMPSSYLLDREGKIRAVHSGFHGEETRKQYLAEIEALLK